ncbi:gliding motility-associated C-terminal domain-containing protein [Paraflavitalea sp. CAU 1676]|uniref:gliding motility-associated C-terminal domain-containing protein n=1 Tax=Paraflavitalea sp. CAU 1676 TaxID=3032598 RepID=UPI0023DAA511|nr:gliding motility-associated C-terminal domain-containing protein [Paraflavitalea sp. CAU 1676]MDF2192140.1 gliding motility-associated C-terminal domain-containing protein [Paraflavitalea sp. CAU 1676]
MKPLVFTLLVCVFSFHLSFADTFVVTSSADSGPGTLRDAIEKANANGTAVTDYIHFNIPEPNYNARVIELINELPALSSNLVIDGTTQPGATYGTTDAKICLRKTTHAPFFSMLKIENAQNVQLYGLHIYYGYWQGIFGGPYRSNDLYGVNIIKSSNIVIGAAGKGNVITGCVHAIYSNSEGCSDITIRSNYLGQTKFYESPAVDIDDVVLSSEACITFASVKNIYIGGPQPADGNIFGNRKRAISIDSKNATGNGLIRIQHNIFARNFDKVTIVDTYDFWDRYINIGRSRNNPVNWSMDYLADYRVELLDNDIPNDASIHHISDSLIILRNKFIYDYRTHGGKLVIGSTGGGLIGGDDPANANYFLNKKPGFAGGAIGIYNSGPITILKNIFICNSSVMSTVGITDDYGRVPFAQVDNTTPTSVTGRATPNARIDLYYDDECSACEGKVYITTLQSDAAGNWTYSAPITGTVIATATKNGYTSMFSFPTFDHKAQKIKNPVCGMNNGSITGITTEGAESYFWINLRTGDTVSKARDLVNAGPGEYVLYAVHGGTCIMNIGTSITLQDVSPRFIRDPYIVQPSCGLTNGSLYDLRIENTLYSKLEWKNELGQVVGNQVDIYQLPAGKYTFYATDLTVGCTAVSPTYVLINQNGPSLNTSALQITPTTCGEANGSITGITASNVTGTPFTQWVNADNQPVSTGYTLSNVPAGTYRFKFKDQGSCDTIIRPFTVTALTSFDPITVARFTTKDGFCAQPDGSISVQAFSKSPTGYTFRWVDAGTGTNMGNGHAINNLPGGTYQLFATDLNQCELKIFTTSVKVQPKPTFDYTALSIKDDKCNQQEGSISSLKISGLASPTTYAWFDEKDAPITGNTPSLQKMPAGTYHLQVTDGGTCTVQSRPFTIGNTDQNLPAPQYDDIIIPRHAQATLTAKNPSSGTYKLFTDVSASALSQQNQTGNFTITTVPADIVYYVQQSLGTCLSPLARVSIKVVDKSYFTIPNAFTPNNDRVNDQLAVRYMGHIQLTYFRIYNRWGQLVFESSRPDAAWDGSWRGVLQPAGTYVWIAEGKDLLGVIIKDRGNFVLIR